MKFSDDRINHVAHVIQKNLLNEKLVLKGHDDPLLHVIKKGLIDFFKSEEQADENARAKIASLKRGVLEGSREWEILYQKYYDEERVKRGH